MLSVLKVKELFKLKLQCKTPCLQSLFLYKIYKVGSCRRRRKIVIKKAWNYTLAKCSTPFSFRPDFQYLSAVVSFLMKKHIDFVFHCFRCRGGSNKFKFMWYPISPTALNENIDNAPETFLGPKNYSFIWGQQSTPLFRATYVISFFGAKELLSLVRSTPLQQIYT